MDAHICADFDKKEMEALGRVPSCLATNLLLFRSCLPSLLTWWSFFFFRGGDTENAYTNRPEEEQKKIDIHMHFSNVADGLTAALLLWCCCAQIQTFALLLPSYNYWTAQQARGACEGATAGDGNREFCFDEC